MPAAAGQVERGHGNLPLHPGFRPTLGAGMLSRGGEPFEFFFLFAAGRAAVFVQRHGILLYLQRLGRNLLV
jgi:hypothetical protein